MLAIKDDGQVDPEHRILPRPGELLLWPAFLHHLVHPSYNNRGLVYAALACGRTAGC